MSGPRRIFSARVPEELAPTRISRAVLRLRQSGVGLIDLTESNPTRVGLVYPPDLLAGLGATRSLVYEPAPFGLLEARSAVAAELARRGPRVDPERVVLAASTSELYSVLFKLLCDPGDTVLVPQPSYPLFDQLARLDGIATAPFRLAEEDGWRVDLDGVARAMPPRARAIVIVNPNNPTGSFVTRAELDEIVRLCRAHGLALIGDEVFADYALPAGGSWGLRSAAESEPSEGGSGAGERAGTRPARPPSVLDQAEVLTFALGGLSKSMGLPQLKLAWMAIGGPPDLVAGALERLEYICDAYLSVATPVQHALPRLLREGAAVRAQIAERIAANYARLGRLLEAAPSCRRLPTEGGWYGIVQVPAVRSEEALVLELLERDQVIVHPGYFFDFPREAFVVVSLLPEPAIFEEGVRRLLARATAL